VVGASQAMTIRGDGGRLGYQPLPKSDGLPATRFRLWQSPQIFQQNAQPREVSCEVIAVRGFGWKVGDQPLLKFDRLPEENLRVGSLPRVVQQHAQVVVCAGQGIAPVGTWPLLLLASIGRAVGSPAYCSYRPGSGGNRGRR